MAYPERKPIYESYKAIVKRIIDEEEYRSYAESAIKELDVSLLSAFESIKNKLLAIKEWLPGGWLYLSGFNARTNFLTTEVPGV